MQTSQTWRHTAYAINECTITLQIPSCDAWRNVQFRLEFPDLTCPPVNTPPERINLIVETGSTVFDVMIAAADRNRDYNFKTTYFGDSGFFIDAINGTASQAPCYWFFDYVIPGLEVQRSQFGVSNVVVPGDGFSIIFKYMRYIPREGDGHWSISDWCQCCWTITV